MGDFNIRKKSDRSVKLICNSMFELLKEKNFEDISITELCNKAELARKTFYRNFKSKEDVIKKSIDMMFREFSNEVHIDKDIEAEKLAYEYFKFWYRRKEFLNLIFENNLFNIVNCQYDLYMRGFRLMMKGEEEMSKDLEYFIIFISGGYWNMLQHWVRKGFSDNPEELAKIWGNHLNKIKCDI